MMEITEGFSLRFLGVGNAHALDLGHAAAVLEMAAQPLMLIDCGPGILSTFYNQYGILPPALFLTHLHYDHSGGLEGWFYRLITATNAVKPRLFIPVDLLPCLQRRVADYPSLLAEGGANFWDAFHLIPVAAEFWWQGLYFHVFPTRHHAYGSAFGLALRGRFLYTGDTRPIPEVLLRFASQGEWIFHDCALQGSPSHSGVADLQREYTPEQQARFILYHYESAAAGAALEQAGFRIARAGHCYALGHAISASPAPA